MRLIHAYTDLLDLNTKVVMLQTLKMLVSKPVMF